MSNFRRSWNARPLGASQTEIHAKWINYLDSDGLWKDIDHRVIQSPTGFSMDKAPFTFRAPLRSIDIAEFESTVRWDIFTKEVISEAPVSMYMKALGVADVPGELFDHDGCGTPCSVIYRNAYPAVGADLIYFVDFGRAPRLKKLIRFNSAIQIDFDAKFEIKFSKPVTTHIPRVVQDLPKLLELRIQHRNLEIERGQLERDGFESLARAKNKEQNLLLIEMSKTRRKAWDGLKVTRAKGDFAHYATGRRGVGWKNFKIWDSGLKENKKKQKVEVSFESAGDHFILTKHIPASFFSGAVLPVFTDTDSTFYPDPDTETTSVDGYTAEFYGAGAGIDWATIIPH